MYYTQLKPPKKVSQCLKTTLFLSQVAIVMVAFGCITAVHIILELPRTMSHFLHPPDIPYEVPC